MMRFLSRVVRDPALRAWTIVGAALLIALVITLAVTFTAGSSAHAVVNHGIVMAPTVNGVHAVAPDYTSSTMYTPYPGHAYVWGTICDPHCHTTVSVSP